MHEKKILIINVNNNHMPVQQISASDKQPITGSKTNQNATTQVFINVLDINDNAPQFEKGKT